MLKNRYLDTSETLKNVLNMRSVEFNSLFQIAYESSVSNKKMLEICQVALTIAEQKKMKLQSAF